MNIKEELEKVEEKVEKTSFAMEMLKFSKEQNVQLENNNKRMFRIWIITFVGLVLSIGYIIYLLNDIGTTQDIDTIDIQDVEQIDNSHIKIGDVAREYPNNIILCTMRGHICCIKYGTIYDTFNPSERIAEEAWIVE